MLRLTQVPIFLDIFNEVTGLSVQVSNLLPDDLLVLLIVGIVEHGELLLWDSQFLGRSDREAVLDDFLELNPFRTEI